MSSSPPIGLVPKFVRDRERAHEILAAITRYMEARKAVPDSWLDELNELVGEKPDGTKAV